jgi:hypothetical protein
MSSDASALASPPISSQKASGPLPISRRLLNAEELSRVGRLATGVRKRLNRLAAGDAELFVAYCRQLARRLVSDKLGKPRPAAQIKASKWDHQKGKCARCGRQLSLLKYSKLSQKNDGNRYSLENTELIHADCFIGR